jgi:putative peptidoglycan lipid II flippase
MVLAAYAIGLASFASVKLLASCHYALQDYRTPLRASIMSIAVSAMVAIAIAIPLRHSPLAATGIALGSALGSYTNLSLLLRSLRARLGTLYTPDMWRGTRRIVIASMVATVVGLVCGAIQKQGAPTMHPRLAGVPVLSAFALTYLGVAWAMGSAEAARWLRLAPRRSVT